MKRAIIGLAVTAALIAGLVLTVIWLHRADTPTPAPSTPPAASTPASSSPSPKTDGTTTGSMVRDHATMLLQRVGQLDEKLPGADRTPRELVALAGRSHEMDGVENTLNDALQTGLHWDDTHPGADNDRQIRVMDDAVDRWSRAMYGILIDQAGGDGDMMVQSWQTQHAKDPSWCPALGDEAGRRPEGLSADRDSYARLMDWENRMVAAGQSCEAADAGRG